MVSDNKQEVNINKENENPSRTFESDKSFFKNKQKNNNSFTRSKTQEVIVVPCEIEMPTELHSLIEMSILPELNCNFEEFVNDRFVERMRQILTNPEEFGKLMLSSVLKSHCLLNNENMLFEKVVSVVRKDNDDDQRGIVK